MILDGIDEVDLKYMQNCAWYTMNATPIRFVRDAPFSASLFGLSLPRNSDNVASADTRFDVDHPEPRAAMERVSGKVDVRLEDWSRDMSICLLFGLSFCLQCLQRLS